MNQQDCMKLFEIPQFSNVRALVVGSSAAFGLCGLTVERSLAILKVTGSNLGRSASR